MRRALDAALDDIGNLSLLNVIRVVGLNVPFELGDRHLARAKRLEQHRIAADRERLLATIPQRFVVGQERARERVDDLSETQIR